MSNTIVRQLGGAVQLHLSIKQVQLTTLSLDRPEVVYAWRHLFHFPAAFHFRSVFPVCSMAAGATGSAASLPFIGVSRASKPNVCRCLFGQPTNEELADTVAELRRYQALVVDEKIQQYNYDFRSDMPLTGSYTWRLRQDDPADLWVGEKATASTPPLLEASSQSGGRLMPVVNSLEVAPAVAADGRTKSAMLEVDEVIAQKDENHQVERPTVGVCCSSMRKRKTIPGGNKMQYNCLCGSCRLYSVLL